MALGSCLAALTFAWGRVDSVPTLYAVWFLMGLAMAATLYEPAFAVVVSWFRPGRRDRALLSVTLAAGFASTIFMPIEAWLLERVGWTPRAHDPGHRAGGHHDPDPRPAARRNPAATTVRAADGSTSSVPGMTLRQASRTLVFWVLAGAFFLSNFSTAVGPVGASLLLLGLGSYPSVFWTLTASLVLASPAVLVAGAGVQAAEQRSAFN